MVEVADELGAFRLTKIVTCWDLHLQTKAIDRFTDFSCQLQRAHFSTESENSEFCFVNDNFQTWLKK